MEGNSSGDVVMIDGVVDEALELDRDGKLYFGQFASDCENIWCFPMYTISTWIKYYQQVNGQDILTFGELLKIYQDPTIGEKDHLSINVSSALRTCVMTVFVPSEVWSHISVSVNGNESISVYVDGYNVTNANFECNSHSVMEDYPNAHFFAGGSGAVSFAVDDVRLLFDALEIANTIRSYKLIPGTVFLTT